MGGPVFDQPDNPRVLVPPADAPGTTQHRAEPSPLSTPAYPDNPSQTTPNAEALREAQIRRELQRQGANPADIPFLASLCLTSESAGPSMCPSGLPPAPRRR